MNPASLFTRVLQQEKRTKAATAPANQITGTTSYGGIPTTGLPTRSLSPNTPTTPTTSSTTNSSRPARTMSFDEEMKPLHDCLLELQQPNATVIDREEQLNRLFTQLRHSTPPAQIQALDMLSTLIAENPALIIGCTNLLSLIIRILQSSHLRFDHEVTDAGTAIFCKLFWLISSIAPEHLNVKDLKRLFRILRRVVERKSPPLLCRLMLSSLADMAGGSNPATAMYVSPTINNSLPLPPPPTGCFDFSGSQSALTLPPMEKFTASKGYTVCIWIRWEQQQVSVPSQSPSPAVSSAPNVRVAAPVAQPIGRGGGLAAPSPVAHLQTPPPLAYIYSFLTDKARGIEGLIGKMNGNVVIRSCSRGVLQELNTDVKVPDRKWCLLTICHKKPQTFSRSSGTVTVYLNEDMRYEGELSYPQLPDPLVFNAFGAATHPSKPSAPFKGKMSTISFHNKPLTPIQISTLYRKGSNFCITVLNQIDKSGKFLNFVSNSISSLLGAITSAATTVVQTATNSVDKSTNDDGDELSSPTNSSTSSTSSSSASTSEQKKQTESYRDIFKNLLCLYHPKCVEQHLALDCSPISTGNTIHEPAHASILPGVQIVEYQDVRDIIHLAIGGITCFFPLFQHLDVVSPTGPNSTSAGGSKKVGHRSSPSSQLEVSSPRVRSQSSILPLLLRTVQLMLRDNVANQISFLQVSGFQIISFLLIRYTSTSHLSENLLVPLEEMIREFSWGRSLNKLLTASNSTTVDDDLSSSPTSSSAASFKRNPNLTNHSLPVARAGEKTMYNDFFLHILLNFGLWFRTPSLTHKSAHSHDHTSPTPNSYPSASAALDDLSATQVPFVVQFEVLLLIKSHILKNPRYFRRLLSAGGGGSSMNPTSSLTAAHAGGASIGPTKFILDSLRRFLNYQNALEQYAHVSVSLAPPTKSSAGPLSSTFFHPFLSNEISTTLRNLRSMRKEWLSILQTLMFCTVGNISSNASVNDGYGTVNPVAPVVRESDITTLLQLICEASESSASSIGSTEPQSPSTPTISSLTSLTAAHSWILAEYLEFLITLLRLRPDEMHPILLRNGGCMLFVSILARNVKYQHVQVAVIHLLSLMLQSSYHDRGQTVGDQLASQVSLVMSALQVALSDSYITTTTYAALIELACGLNAGALNQGVGQADAADEAIERFCNNLTKLGEGDEEAHDVSSLTHPPSSASPTGSTSPVSPTSSNSSRSSAPSRATILARAAIRFPRALELIHSLILNNDNLRVKDRRRMKEWWNAESLRMAGSRANAVANEQPIRTGLVGSLSEDSLSSLSIPPTATHTHRSSDNIHYDEEITPTAVTIHPPISPFTTYHPTHNPSLGSHIHLLTSPIVPLSQFLFDLDLVLANSAGNCQILLSKWSLGMKMCMKELDWIGPVKLTPVVKQADEAKESKEKSESDDDQVDEPPSPSPPPISTSEEERAIAEKFEAQPPVIFGVDMAALLDEPQQHHHASIDDSIVNKAPVKVTRPSIAFSSPSNDPYLQVVFRQHLLADDDLANTPAASIPLPQIASKIIETLLFHSLVHVKDGWMYWRDSFLLLRLEAEQQQQLQEQLNEERKNTSQATSVDRFIITEERFRSVRRNLFIHLFQRIEQIPVSAASPNQAASNQSTLHLNLAHIIDLLEEILYFDNTQRFKHLKFRMVDSEGNETSTTVRDSTSGSLRKLSRNRSLNSSTTANGGGDAWVLMDEDDDSGLSDSERSSNHRSDSSSASAPAHPSFFRQEWSMIRELLQCLVHVRFSLQPTNKFTNASLGTIDPISNEFASGPLADLNSLVSPTNVVPLRTGGPLRVVIRLLLDCCSAVCLSTEHYGTQPASRSRAGSVVSGPLSSDSYLTQLQDMVSQLGALVHVELDSFPSGGSTQQRTNEKSTSPARELKNRYVLHILWRLCQIMHILPTNKTSSESIENESVQLPPSPSEQMRRILHSTVNQIVESLKPFAVVPANYFDSASNTTGAPVAQSTSPMAIQDRNYYVSLIVNDDGFLDADPNFQLPNLRDVSLISSSLYPRIMRCCNEYIAGSVQLFHSLELKFADEFVPEQEKLERTIRKRLKDGADSSMISKDQSARASWRAVQTYSYAEVNRRAVVDTFYSDHLLRLSGQWRLIAHDLYHDGSSWSSSDSAARRKFYKIDTREDGYRMRRKLKVCMEGEDHHQASQAYIDHMRTITMMKEKEKKLAAANAVASHKKKQESTSSITPKKPLTLQPPSTLHASSSSPSLSAQTIATAPTTTTPEKVAINVDEPSASPLPSPSPDSISDPGVVVDATTFELENETTSLAIERERLEKLNEIGKALGSSLKTSTDAQDVEEDDLDLDQVEETKLDTEGVERSEPVTRKIRAGSMDGDEEDEEERANEDPLTSLPIKSKQKPSGSDGANQQQDDWDMCEVASANPVASGNNASASSTSSIPSSSAPMSGVPSFNPASIYTSPFCTLVLPIGIVYGTLEISPSSLKFSFNPHAEQQLLQQQLIAAEQLVKSLPPDSIAHRMNANPPPKAKPFTLPSLDALRHHARKDRVWPLNSIVAVYRRRYQLQKTALEIFLLNGKNYFIDFATRNERKAVLRKILGLRPPKLIRLCSRSVQELLNRSRLTEKWVNRDMSNFEYLMHLNTVSGRTYNDINQYPVFPWILSYYPEQKVKLVPADGSSSSSTPTRAVEVKDENEIDLEAVIRAGPTHPDTPRIFRDLHRPMGALDPHRLEQILERFNTFFDTTIPPFHYGSHYSNAAIVLFYLMRLEPYASLHIELQAGKFDWADRLFYSIGQTWKNCCTSLSCYKELIPEFFYSEVFLENLNQYDLGIKQDGQLVSDVGLPKWANDSSTEFIRLNRLALESEYVSQNLHGWIDLIFGYKQKGVAAKEAHNLFFHLTYEGAVDMNTVKDPVLLEAIKEQIAQFGQTPVQLFKKPHPHRLPVASAKLQRLTLSSTLAQMLEQSDYHHPSLRRITVLKDAPIYTIKPFIQNKFATISAGFVFGLHHWQYDVGSEVEEVGPGLGNRPGTMRRYALPFSYGLASTQAYVKHNPYVADSATFTSDGRLFLEGNVWDDSLRVYQVSSSIHLESVKRSDKSAHAASPIPYGELKLTLSQSLVHHHDRITLAVLGRDEKTLVTGSKDCTLLVWNLDVEEPISRVSGMFREGALCVRSQPTHILRGHEDAIMGLAVDSEMDVCVSISTRGQVLMHSLKKGQFIQALYVPRVEEVTRWKEAIHARTIANATAAALAALNGGVAPANAPPVSSGGLPPTAFQPPQPTDADSLVSRSRTGSILATPSQLHLPKLVCFGSDGCLVFYSVVWDSVTKRFMSPQLSVCSIHGRHWRATALEEYLMCMTMSADGKLIASGSEDGMLVLRRLHDLKVVQRFEPVMASITAIAFSYEQEYLFVGTSSGSLHIFAVKC